MEKYFEPTPRVGKESDETKKKQYFEKFSLYFVLIDYTVNS